MAETTWLDATALADLVRRGELSPGELAEAAIARIEAVNPRLDAVIRDRFAAGPGMAGDVLPRGAVPGCWLRLAGPYQRAGTRHHGDHRAAQLPAGPQPLAARSFRWRLVGRIGGRGGQRHGAGGARQRRRRIDPHPGERVRAGRAQADPRAGESRPADRGGMGRRRYRWRRDPDRA